MQPADPVLVSAHRFGAGDHVPLENSRSALLGALALDVDFVEFDVQRCADGTFVVSHAPSVRIDGERLAIGDLTIDELERRTDSVLRYTEVLDLLAGRAKAHIDLKFTSPERAYAVAGSTYEVEAARLAVDRLGHDQLIVTTLDDQAVRALRDWSDEAGVALLVGLSLGRSTHGLAWHRKLRVRLSELRPRLRYLNTRANVVVVNHTLARLGVAAFARRRGLPLLVWTIDTDDSLRYWLRTGRAWALTTNYPRRALELRDQAVTGRVDRS